MEINVKFNEIKSYFTQHLGVFDSEFFNVVKHASQKDNNDDICQSVFVSASCFYHFGSLSFNTCFNSYFDWLTQNSTGFTTPKQCYRRLPIPDMFGSDQYHNVQ